MTPSQGQSAPEPVIPACKTTTPIGRQQMLLVWQLFVEHDHHPYQRRLGRRQERSPRRYWPPVSTSTFRQRTPIYSTGDLARATRCYYVNSKPSSDSIHDYRADDIGDLDPGTEVMSAGLSGLADGYAPHQWVNRHALASQDQV
jgi:hypothetical protein